jgi:hypothetical protein
MEAHDPHDSPKKRPDEGRSRPGGKGRPADGEARSTGKGRPRRKSAPKLTRKKLDKFLSKLCESAGMGAKPAGKGAETRSAEGLVCRGPCRDALWKSHLDIPSGILCVSAAWSTNAKSDKHKDVTLAVTYLGDDGKPGYEDIVFCDSEVRWLLETLWHAPIWE